MEIDALKRLDLICQSTGGLITVLPLNSLHLQGHLSCVEALLRTLFVCYFLAILYNI